MGRELNVAILGVTGAVGQEFMTLLEQRKFPVRELRLLASKRSAGKKVVFKGKEIEIQEAAADSFQGIDVVLSSAGGSVSKQLAPAAVSAGALVVDNTSAFRMDAHVPLVVPEINPEDISKHQGIIANPNCSTIIMLMPIAPLRKLGKVTRILAATYQSASGAGAQAMLELENQSREILEGKLPTKNAFPHQIAFNLFSHNSKIDADGNCEEEVKMIRETKKIFHDDSIRVMATTIRVPVFRAHSEALVIEFEKRPTVTSICQVLKEAPGIKIVDERERNYFPMPIEASKQDDIFVGRIREDLSSANGICMFISGDQLRKGAALNAVQIAEKAFNLR